MLTDIRVDSEGQGPTLVMLHGWGMHSGIWQPLQAALTKRFQLLLIDLPGFGHNRDALPAQYNLASIAALLKPVVPKQSLILGWSLGGLVAQQLLLDKALELRAGILLCSSPKFQAEADWPGIQPQVLDTFFKQLRMNYDKTLDRFLAIQALGSPTAKADLRTIREQLNSRPEPHPQALRGGLQILAEADLRESVAQIPAPLLWMFGANDSLVPASIGSTFPATSQQVQFAQASHAPFMSHPEDFLTALFSFVDSLQS